MLTFANICNKKSGDPWLADNSGAGVLVRRYTAKLLRKEPDKLVGCWLG